MALVMNCLIASREHGVLHSWLMFEERVALPGPDCPCVLGKLAGTPYGTGLPGSVADGQHEFSTGTSTL